MGVRFKRISVDRNIKVGIYPCPYEVLVGKRIGTFHRVSRGIIIIRDYLVLSYNKSYPMRYYINGYLEFQSH